MNKRVVEVPANKTYEMEIHQKPGYHIWSYLKAAWAIEGLKHDIGLIYTTMGVKSIQKIRHVGSSLADKIAEMIVKDCQVNDAKPVNDNL